MVVEEQLLPGRVQVAPPWLIPVVVFLADTDLVSQLAGCPEAAPSQLELPHAMHVSRGGQQLVFRQQVAD